MRNRYVIYHEEEYMWIHVPDLELMIHLLARLAFRKYLNNLHAVGGYKHVKTHICDSDMNFVHQAIIPFKDCEDVYTPDSLDFLDPPALTCAYKEIFIDVYVYMKGQEVCLRRIW